MANGKSMRLFEHRVAATAAKALSRGPGYAKWADDRLNLLTSARLVAEQLAGVDNADLALANASVYLEAFGHIVMDWVWLEQALIAPIDQSGGRTDDAALYRGKLQAKAAVGRNFRRLPLDSSGTRPSTWRC